jgi:hypothetical protein
MVSQTCLVGFTAGALAIGVLIGLLWSSRQGHGEHAAYDPAFSAAAVIDRVHAAQNTTVEDDNKADAEPAPPTTELSGKSARANTEDVQLYGRHPDDPALFRYHVSAPRAHALITSNELTQPLRHQPPRPTNHRTQLSDRPHPADQRSGLSSGRHVLHPPNE